MSVSDERKMQRLGALFGFLGAVAFAATAWGIDAVILSRTKLVYPFIRFLPGFAMCVLVGTFVGWLTIRIGSRLAALGIWYAYATFLSWLMFWLPFKWLPTIVKFRIPYLKYHIAFPTVYDIEAFRSFSLILIILCCITCGVRVMDIIEKQITSFQRKMLYFLLIVSIVVMGSAGYLGDKIINREFRAPVQTLHELLKFAEENQGKVIDEQLAESMHYSAVIGLESLIHKPRRIVLVSFDQTLTEMIFMVYFEGTWAKCQVENGTPVQCLPTYDFPIRVTYQPGF